MKFYIKIWLLSVGIVSNVYGTIQFPEILMIGNDTFYIEEYPLNAILEKKHIFFT